MVKWLVAAIAAAMICPAGASAGEDGDAAIYRFFVFNEPLPGQEEEYLRFYEERHLADVVSIPGLVNGRRYVLADQQLAPKATTPRIPRYLTLYTIKTDNLGAVKSEMARRIASGETRQSTTYDRAASLSFFYRSVGREHVSAQPLDSKPDAAGNASTDYLHFVQTASLPGREQEYDRWYVDHHLSEMITTRGFRSSQRLELADPGRTEPPPARYAALFAIHTGDIEAVIAAYRAGAANRTPSEAADRNATRGYTFRAIGSKLTHEEAKGSQRD